MLARKWQFLNGNVIGFVRIVLTRHACRSDKSGLCPVPQLGEHQMTGGSYVYLIVCG
jgi:hypothetical protein